MSEIIVGTKLQSTKSNLVATVVEINKKCKQAIVDLSDGTNKAYSLATLKDKRTWTVINNDDEYVEEIMQQKKELGIECPEIKSYEVVEENHLVPMPGIEKLAELKEEYCADGRTYEEIGKEIAAQAAIKAEAHKSNMVDSTLLAKFTKKEQKVITGIYHTETGYHVTAERDGIVTTFNDKSLLRIGLEIRKIAKGEE